MANTLKVSAFIVLVVVAIAAFASAIPQLESPAPKVLAITADMSGAELAALGQTVFESPEAGCAACHAVGRAGLRGPDLAGIGSAAAGRVAGESAEVYLRKSIVEPCDHVVAGYDCIMPPTLLNTLGEAKVTALVAYMQSLGGEITVKYSGEPSAGGAPPAGGAAALPGTTAQEILASAGCVGCHKIGELGANPGLGPDLSQLGRSSTPEAIRRAILAPDESIAGNCPKKDEAGTVTAGPCAPGLMPKDYGQKLSAAQLETLVTFLSELK